MIATFTHKYESIFCSDILLFTDSHEFDHVFSFNGFLGFSKTSMAALFYWIALQMVASGWHLGLLNGLRSELTS